MVLVYERSRSIPYVHGAIFQFTSLKYGLCYRFQWSWGVMASQIITLKSSTTGLFCFQKFVHDNPPKFRHNGLLRGESIGRRRFPSLKARNVEGVSTPWRLMITYKRHRYMWNNIHLIRQIVCMRIPDNAIFWVVGLDQHGIYILTFRILIYVINYYSTRKFATNGGFLRSYFTTCMNRAHFVQAQYSIK